MFFVNGLIILITVLNIVFFYLRQHQEEEQEYVHRNKSLLSSSSSLASQCRRFSLAEIKSATHNFDEGLVIGKGGFGEVYKGVIDDGVTTVAIKRLGFWSKQGAPEFWTEIEMLSKFRHSHLVSLIGFCDENPEMVIVYEYMPGGTLADNLYKMNSSNRALSWEQRLKVCIGGARGLDYLHTGTDIQTRVIHRDVKSSNILLDANLEAKISDFGLSKIGPAEQPCTHVSTHVKGTFGYLDPEYLLTRRLTRKSDVYAFGVVMFETLCGRAAVNVRLEEEQWSLAKWAKRCIKEGKLHEIVDLHLRGSILSECLNAFAQIAEQCLNNSSRKRPTMAQVVTRLEYVLALQEGTSFSLIDADIINSGGKYDSREAADLYTEAEPRDSGGMNFSREREVFYAGTGGYLQEHAAKWSKSHIQIAKKIKFVKSMGSLFSTKVRMVTDDEHSDLRVGQLKWFSLREIHVATDNYSSSNCLSSCGFDKVYQGQLGDGSLVAIKTHDKRHIYGGKLQFQKEVEAIGKAVHRNLLQLHGFCMRSTERVLVYPYMGNGSVASHLRERREGQPALDWLTRKRIALCCARGLAYLHDDFIPAIIHRKIKAANIFLNEEFEVVIGNFGLANCMYQSDSLIYPVIIGVTAPKYLTTGKFSTETDVYAYGVMLLELITGQRPYDLAERADAENVWIFDWVKRFLMEKKLETLIDVGLDGNYVYDEVEQLTQVALLCTQASLMVRPRMSEVVGMLQGDRWVDPQKGNTYSNPSYSKNTLIADSVEDIPSEELLSPR